ncbi:Leucine-rich repeat-containing protein 70 [Zootermopsis nevadensis]|uniref:Leucine-rich repeat-containing protein 70 n=2 Tax=Zootermopsis nevadensis TaxID=136037 RepID=A0A067QVE7_ZOONE|nr:Leucine-rich repeat-containing protein 70 [Zootermopsis nevadensis]
MGVISLKELNASRNSIIDIHEEAFVGQSRLQTLDLSSNNLSYIEPNAFIRNPSLKWLSLSGNGFGMLPEEGYFLYSESVRVLHLSACNLRFIPTETFQGLPNLQELYISHNLIDILPPLGTGFLTVLDISNNNLRDLDSDIFTSSPKIIRLNLSYNGLKTLNIEMMPQLAKVIRTGDLSGNPWLCDCLMFNTTYSWCHDNGVDLKLTCSSPPKFKGRKWTEYDREGCDENVFDEVDEFTVTGNGLTPVEKHAKFENLQEAADILTSREEVTEFKSKYFYTSLALFGLLIVLTAVAASMFCYLRRSRVSMRKGPALNNEEESHLSIV